MQKINLPAKMTARNCQLTLDTVEVKIFTEITLSHTVSKINALLHFIQNFKMATKTGGKNNFWKEMPDDSADNLGVKSFIEITLSFLHFLCRISRWLTYMAGKHFWQKLPDDYADTLGVNNFVKITISHHF